MTWTNLTAERGREGSREWREAAMEVGEREERVMGARRRAPRGPSDSDAAMRMGLPMLAKGKGRLWM